MTRAADMTDLAWFKANREANCRVRDPLPGEVDELARMLLPTGASAEWDNGFALPAGQCAQVVVMKPPRRRQKEQHLARFVGAAPCDAAGKPSGPMPGFCLVPIVLGARVAIA